MLCAIIDVGSNTMRLTLYYYEQTRFQPLLHKKAMAGLMGYVENGRLSEEGLQKAADVLAEYRRILDNFGVEEVHVFATAIVRNIDNSTEVLDALRLRSGFDIELLSGEREAQLDFLGATHFFDAQEGMVVDIGGGSTQLVVFRKGEILASDSLPIGSLNTYSRRVEGLFPTERERKDIVDRMEEALAGLTLRKQAKGLTICGVGGSIRACLRLSKELFEPHHPEPVLTPSDLNRLLAFVREKEPKKLVKTLSKILPDRIHTFTPGLLLLWTIVREWDCPLVMVSDFGVREGYLIDKLQRLQTEQEAAQ